METLDNKNHHDHSHSHRHGKHRSENVYVYQVDSIVGKNILNFATTSAVLGQLLFFLANFSVSSALGSDGESFVLIAFKSFGGGFFVVLFNERNVFFVIPIKVVFS